MYGPESKICPKYFQEFPKKFTYYASQYSYYACIMLLCCQQFYESNDCSIRVFHYKVIVLLESIDLRSYVQCIWVFFCSLNISLTALLESIDLIKLSILKHLPIMLALCQHNTLAYYAFYYAGIFDAGLPMYYI